MKIKNKSKVLLVLMAGLVTPFNQGFVNLNRPVYAESLQRISNQESIVIEDNDKNKFIEDVQSEMKSSNFENVNVYILGNASVIYKENLPKDQISSILEDKYKFVKLNGKAIHGMALFIMKKEDRLVKNIDEYNKIMDERLKNISEFKNIVIHTTFPIKDKDFIEVRLNAVGLSMGRGIKHIGINGVNIYTRNLNIDNRFAFNISANNKEQYNKYINLNLDRIKQNDEAIKKIILEAGSNEEGIDDREKIIRFILQVGKNTVYDREAYYNDDRLLYYLASDIFSVTERHKAMCLGFSTFAARGLNLMGIPAYVIEGRNYNGEIHATTRAFYNKKWHVLDLTASIGSLPSYTRDMFSDDEDLYAVVDSNNKTEYYENKFMHVNKEFEDWIINYNSKDILLLNKDAALRSRIPANDLTWYSKEHVDKLVAEYEKVIKIENEEWFKNHDLASKVLLTPKSYYGKLLKNQKNGKVELDHYKKLVDALNYTKDYFRIECEKLKVRLPEVFKENTKMPYQGNKENIEKGNLNKDFNSENEDKSLKNKWIYKNGDYYYIDNYGKKLKNKWQGNYYLKSDGKMAKSEWIFDKDYDSYYYLLNDGKYAKNKWQGNYYLKNDGKMAKSEWIFDKDYDSYYYLLNDGKYAKNKWQGNYYLKSDGKMAKSEWIFDKDYDSYYYLLNDGKYAKNKWQGNYYLKSDGKMAKSEWIGKYHVDNFGKWDKTK